MPGIIDLPKFNYEDLEEIVTVQARNQDFMWGGANEAKVDQNYRYVFLILLLLIEDQ